jgi:hypothetical protein
MFRPLTLAIISLFDMEYLSLSYTGIWVVRCVGGGCESARSHIIEKGTWTGVCAVGNMLNTNTLQST